MKRYLIIITAIVFYTSIYYTVEYTIAEEYLQTGNSVSIYADVKAKKIGDVLSVIISENNSASKNAQTNTNKQNKASAEGTATSGALEGLFPGMGGEIDLGNQYKGQASTTRSGKFTSRMTVIVVDVLPNRNLVIEGTKTMEINEDLEVMTLSGIVKPEHISSENTIYSYEIANAKITYKGKGSVSQGHRIGILGRILNWVF